MDRRLIRCTFILGLAALLAACGFQLRGTGSAGEGATLPDDWRYLHLVTANPNSEFSREIRSRFAANGIHWMERDEANYVVVLGPEHFKQRNLSLNAEARVAEYELSLRARFSVLDSNNGEVMPAREVTTLRQMENDPRNVVGKAEEVRILRSEMRADLARQIMRRIGFFAASTQ
ncbi:MAG: hypothetical protein KDI16_01885 [Halioglobus sp.]|nr:hypothetical protein [Halioglobus sp.]